MDLPIWPDRFLSQQRHYGRERGYRYMRDQHMVIPWDDDGGPAWPGYQGMLWLYNGVLPTSLETAMKSRHGKGVFMAWQHKNWEKMGLVDSRDTAFMRAADNVMVSVNVARWIHDGRRCYELDESTAIALLDTDFSDVPSALLRFPVNAFWLVLPSTFRWIIPLDDVPGDPNVQLEALIEGYLIGLESTEDGHVKSVNAVACGRGTAPGDYPYGEPSRLHFLDVPEPNQTLASLAHTMSSDPSAEASDPKAALAQLLVGLGLYIQSVHPRLVTQTIEPPPPRVAQPWKRRKFRSPGSAPSRVDPRLVITYVGGPDQGHHEAAEESKGETDISLLARKPPKPHVRAGHFAHTWVGAHDSPDRHAELRWRRPTKVGDWSRVVHYESLRKGVLRVARTRPAIPGVHPDADELLRATPPFPV